jgi:hypothetical protein
MSEIIKKKRGRKPKNFNNTIVKKESNIISEDDIITEEEKIIFHLPITMNEINNMDTPDMSIFIKSEDLKNCNKNQKVSEDSELVESIKSSTIVNNIIMAKISLTNPINKIQTHTLKFNTNTKCWWCRNGFSSPAIQLPEDYYNETFFCIGHFCSFNCMKSYNLNLNDNLSFKRESLMNLLYYMTYSEYKNIIQAPNWMSLEEYGGTLTIEKFRENSIINTKEYLVLHPPLISRQMQIEESYKLSKLKEVPIDKINKMYSEIDTEYTIKRNKPVSNNMLNLETTMGLVKSKKK